MQRTQTHTTMLGRLCLGLFVFAWRAPPRSPVSWQWTHPRIRRWPPSMPPTENIDRPAPKVRILVAVTTVLPVATRPHPAAVALALTVVICRTSTRDQNCSAETEGCAGQHGAGGTGSRPGRPVFDPPTAARRIPSAEIPDGSVPVHTQLCISEIAIPSNVIPDPDYRRRRIPDVVIERAKAPQ